MREKQEGGGDSLLLLSAVVPVASASPCAGCWH